MSVLDFNPTEKHRKANSHNNKNLCSIDINKKSKQKITILSLLFYFLFFFKNLLVIEKVVQR